MYQLTQRREGEQFERILRTEDGAMIPADPGNRDYQQYLLWVAEGNEPLAVSEQ
ncbi:hypothetical protein [Pandoraea pnomenusa]|uniref:hypothetical protein n=1 Tax=Pandoraea pnomenusa TaxID=93220 RepID=UPI00242A35FA|nr:hypothetical protein [Pandoraea pnomenusa]